jgi:Holliday junction resolvase-like predicted endonuclease
MIKKTRIQTIDAVRKALPSIGSLYKEGFANRKGTTSDTGELYTEIIAGELLLSLGALKGISPISRRSSYYTPNHCKVKFDLCKSYDSEVIFAKRLTGLDLPEVGLILDNQVPLKSRRKQSAGKIDLISFNGKTKTLHLIELKYDKNKETLLRAMLEIYTYFKVIDWKKMINNYRAHYNFKNRKLVRALKPNKTKIVPTVLVTPNNCTAYNELQEMRDGKRPNLLTLSKKLKIGCLVMEISVNQR